MNELDFNEVEELYNSLREEERIKIVRLLDNNGYTNKKGKKLNAQGGKGKPNYTNYNQLKVSYDLTNWKYVEACIDGVEYFISLQAFDRDKNSGNFHVLVNRIGICMFPDNGEDRDYFNTMETTSLELPLDESDLECLLGILEDMRR